MKQKSTPPHVPADCDLSVAFTRWVSGREADSFDLEGLMRHPAVRRMLAAPVQAPGPRAEAGAGAEAEAGAEAGPQAGPREPSGSADGASEGLHGAGPAAAGTTTAAGAGADGPGPERRRPRVALVFGREELGLRDDEVAACGALCSIPIGRLQVGVCVCVRV